MFSYMLTPIELDRRALEEKRRIVRREYEASADKVITTDLTEKMEDEGIKSRQVRTWWENLLREERNPRPERGPTLPSSTALQVLREYLQVNLETNEEDYHDLAAITGLTPIQVKSWFSDHKRADPVLLPFKRKFPKQSCVFDVDAIEPSVLEDLEKAKQGGTNTSLLISSALQALKTAPQDSDCVRDTAVGLTRICFRAIHRSPNQVKDILGAVTDLLLPDLQLQPEPSKSSLQFVQNNSKTGWLLPKFAISVGNQMSKLIFRIRSKLMIPPLTTSDVENFSEELRGFEKSRQIAGVYCLEVVFWLLRVAECLMTQGRWQKTASVLELAQAFLDGQRIKLEVFKLCGSMNLMQNIVSTITHCYEKSSINTLDKNIVNLQPQLQKLNYLLRKAPFGSFWLSRKFQSLLKKMDSAWKEENPTELEITCKKVLNAIREVVRKGGYTGGQERQRNRYEVLIKIKTGARVSRKVYKNYK